jgi:hypothetical protein
MSSTLVQQLFVTSTFHISRKRGATVGLSMYNSIEGENWIFSNSLQGSESEPQGEGILIFPIQHFIWECTFDGFDKKCQSGNIQGLDSSCIYVPKRHTITISFIKKLGY